MIWLHRDKISAILFKCKRQDGSVMKFSDTADKKHHTDIPDNMKLPLLPNELNSKFWNQKWKKLVFTQIMQAEGSGKHGLLTYTSAPARPFNFLSN